MTAPSPTAAGPPTPPRGALLVFAPVVVVGVLLGAMLGGVALGLREAERLSPAGVIAAAPPAALVAGDAGTPPDAPLPETDPEATGDGVMDDLDDGPAALAASGASGTSGATAPAHAPAAAPAGGARARGAGRMVTSDDVPEGPAQGYVDRHPVRIVVTRIDGKPVEVRTAAAFRQLRDAAAHDHVRLRVVSGFRTMEHQQALYRAWRHGHGNLAAQPGTSNHQSGHALDLNASAPGVFRWLQRNAGRFGFRRTVPTEPWHWEWW